MRFYGEYDSMQECEKALLSIRNKLEHQAIPIIYANSQEWVILPLTPTIPSEKNLSYD